MSDLRPGRLAQIVAFAALMGVLAYASVALTTRMGDVAVVWPMDALTVAFAMRWGRVKAERVLTLAIDGFSASFSGEHGLGRAVQDAYDRFTPPAVQDYAAAVAAVFGRGSARYFSVRERAVSWPEAMRFWRSVIESSSSSKAGTGVAALPDAAGFSAPARGPAAASAPAAAP